MGFSYAIAQFYGRAYCSKQTSGQLFVFFYAGHNNKDRVVCLQASAENGHTPNCNHEAARCRGSLDCPLVAVRAKVDSTNQTPPGHGGETAGESINSASFRMEARGT